VKEDGLKKEEGGGLRKDAFGRGRMEEEELRKREDGGGRIEKEGGWRRKN